MSDRTKPDHRAEKALRDLMKSHEHLCRVLVVRDETWATLEAAREAVPALLDSHSRLVEALRDIRDNFDCEDHLVSKAHQCQSCIARDALALADQGRGEGR